MMAWTGAMKWGGSGAACRFVLFWLVLAASTPVWAIPDALRLKLSNALDALMTEIRFTDSEVSEAPYSSRILILDNRMRIDFGRDDQGFLLFDRSARTIWHVSPTDQRLTGVVAGAAPRIWPGQWVLSQDVMPGEQGVLHQVRVNDALCVEFKAMSSMRYEADMLADFRRALMAKQAKIWLDSAEDERHPCRLALDVHAAGVEYRQGMPLAIRYWDGRTRVFQSQQRLTPRPELFELPANYVRTLIREGDQGNVLRRQPSASQVR